MSDAGQEAEWEIHYSDCPANQFLSVASLNTPEAEPTPLVRTRRGMESDSLRNTANVSEIGRAVAKCVDVEFKQVAAPSPNVRKW